MSREAGFRWENEFVETARSHGLSARRIYGQKTFDAVVGSVRVQCKEKQFHEHGRVRIAKGQKKYRAGDWDVLALRFLGEKFFIPAHALLMPGGTLKTVIRPAMFAKYKDAWSVFDGYEFAEDERLLFEIH